MATKKVVKEVKKTRKPKAVKEPTALDKIDERIAHLKNVIAYGESQLAKAKAALKNFEDMRRGYVLGDIPVAAQEVIISLL
jgi:uncharacterized small protein (DUF1192 family)